MFIPPPSPTPGCATGEVCMERTATLRTGMLGILGVSVVNLGRGLEGAVHLDQRLFLALGDRGVGQDPGHEIGVALAGFEDPGPYVERFGRDAQRPGDRLEDLRARLPQAPLDLAEVRIGYAGQLRQLAQREAGHAALVANESAQLGQRGVIGQAAVRGIRRSLRGAKIRTTSGSNCVPAIFCSSSTAASTGSAAR